MDLKTAQKLKVSKYAQDAEFQELCRFADKIDVGIGPEFEYRRQDGILMRCPNLVRQAEYANCKQKGDNEARASLEFVLNYLDNGYIPFTVFDNEAGRLAKAYRSATGKCADESAAMAAVIELTIRREQRKLGALTELAKMQNSHAQAVGDSAAIVWRTARASTAAEYNVDKYNKCAGYLAIEGAPEGTMNMTVDKNGLCMDEAWEKVFSHVREKKALHPTRSSRRTKVVDLQQSLLGYFNRAKDVMGYNISCKANVAVGSIRVPVFVEDKDKGRKTVYVFAAPHRKPNGRGFCPCLLDDYMDILKYGGYLDYKGEKIDELVLVGTSFNRATTEEFELAFAAELETHGLKKKLRYMTHRDFFETFG